MTSNTLCSVPPPWLRSNSSSLSLWNALWDFCSPFITSLLPPPSLSVAPGMETPKSVFHFLAIHHDALPVASILRPQCLTLFHIECKAYSGCYFCQSPSPSLLMLLNLENSRAMLSAKSKSTSSVVKFHHIPLLMSAVTFLIIQSRAGKNKNPNITHPCFTPDLILNQSAVSIGPLQLSHHVTYFS